jgi:hypothetical protein
MTPKTKWNIQLLKQLENTLGFKLLLKQEFDEKTIHVYSRIRGICALDYCNKEWDKTFRDLDRCKNPYCSLHTKQKYSKKKTLEYIETLEKIKEKIPNIELKYPNDEILTQRSKIEFKCMISQCKQNLERYLHTLLQHEDIYDETMYCCDDCFPIVASYKKDGIKMLFKDTEYFNDLYEIPKYIDYITIYSTLILKFKCNQHCPNPNCMLEHEYYETQVSSKCRNNSGCNKCLHLNNCACVVNSNGFICLTCSSYFDDKEIKDKNCNTCKICRSKYNNENIQLTINALVSKTYTRNKKGRKQKTSELTNDFVMSLYEKQNKCCYYSNIPLRFIKFGDWKLSIERLDINKNYTKDNVALTCIEFQSGFRPWNKNKWHDFCINYFKYQEPLNTNELNELERQYQKANVLNYSKVNGYKQTKIFIDEIKKEKLCHKCKQIKHLDNDFTKSGLTNHTCKECIKDINDNQKQSLRGRLLILLNSSKNNTNYRKEKKTITKRKDLTHKITIIELLDMWKLQNGRCYYSNYPMNMNGDYQISLERKDNKLGYTKENCVLICLEFNVGGHEIYNLEVNDNSYSWNKEKISYAVNTYLDYLSQKSR